MYYLDNLALAGRDPVVLGASKKKEVQKMKSELCYGIA